MDKEFLQFIKETKSDDLLNINERDIIKYKNTLFYQKWLLERSGVKIFNNFIEVYGIKKLIIKILDWMLKKWGK